MIYSKASTTVSIDCCVKFSFIHFIPFAIPKANILRDISHVLFLYFIISCWNFFSSFSTSYISFFSFVFLLVVHKAKKNNNIKNNKKKWKSVSLAHIFSYFNLFYFFFSWLFGVVVAAALAGFFFFFLVLVALGIMLFSCCFFFFFL